MKIATLSVFLGLFVALGGCKVDVQSPPATKAGAAKKKSKKKGSEAFSIDTGPDGTSITIRDGDDVVKLSAGG